MQIDWRLLAAVGGAVLLLAVLAVLIRFLVKRRRRTFQSVGTEFERYCAGLLWNCGFREVELTGASGDFGVDIFARKDGVTWAFQCKCYDKPVGLRAVQEIYSGKDFFHCMVGVVMTNNSYTGAARKMAEELNILLWDGEMLLEMEKR